MSYPPPQFSAANFSISRWDMDSIKHQNPYLHHRITNLRPVSQFFKLSHLGLPKSLQEWKTRVVANFNYFQSNYLVVLILVALVQLFQNLLLLCAIIVLAVGVYALQRYELDEIVVAGNTLRLNKNYLYVALFGTTVPVILWCSPFSTLINLVSVTSAIVALHASVFEAQGETAFSESPV